MATTTNPNRMPGERLTPRMAQDKKEREDAATRAMGWFLLAVIALMVIAGAYYYATQDERAADGTYITDQTATPVTGTMTVSPVPADEPASGPAASQ